MDITSEDNFLCLCDQKAHLNMSPIVDNYRGTAAWNLEHRVWIIENKWGKIINKHNI